LIVHAFAIYNTPDKRTILTPGGGLTVVLTLPAAPARPAAEPRGTRRIRAA